jgi:hypothetical protein
MPVDFTDIESGEKFELLCEDLLRAMGFAIEAKVARGPDLGKDIITTQTVTDRAGFSETHRYLVECKHHAKGGKSVREKDIGSPIARMGTHNCDRYILVTSTIPSEKVRAQLAGIPNAVSHYRATVWHEGDLTRLLDQYPDVRGRHFPSEAVPTVAVALSKIVEGLLAAMSFTCQRDNVTDDYVRLVCTCDSAFPGSVAVVCKADPVDQGDVEALITEVKAQGKSGGILVTYAGVLPIARERAVETGGKVQVFTLEEFCRYASTATVAGPGRLEKARSTLRHLRGLRAGARAAYEYEKDVHLVLAVILHPHLTDPRSQAQTISGARKRDILFSNFSSHPFWQRMGQRHDATLIVFEVKNVEKLRVIHVDQVAGYLTPGVGRLGFLVSHTRAEAPMLRRAVHVYHADGRVILFLCDDDLEEMLKLKGRGEDPTELIEQRYNDFITLT